MGGVRTPPSDVRPARGPPISASRRPAIIASAIVNTDCPSASGTLVLCLLFPEEDLHTVSPDIVQVLDHAHIVFSSVSFIQMFQIVAGRIVTSKTKLYFTLLNNFTVFDFTSNNGNGFIGICCPATRAFISFSQIGHANAAVHSTRRDESLIHDVYHAAALLALSR